MTHNWSPISVSPSTSDYPSTHCPCGAGFCEIRVSNSKQNPNRKYYCCPGKFENHCDHFKWCDKLKKEEILTIQPKKYPFCGCGAGVCRVEIEKSGLDDAGISYFVCPIGKGNGACNFKQRVNDDPELLLEYLSPEDEMILDDVVSRALDFSPAEDQLQMENGLDRSFDIAEGISSGSPRHHLHSDANNISGNTLALEWTAEDDELLLKMGDFEAQNVDSSNRVTKTIQDPISIGFNLLNMPEDSLPSNNSSGMLNPPKQPSVLNDKLNEKTTEDIFKALEKLSLCLENDFTTVSQSAGLKKHENKIKERCAFAPLDYLRVDYGLFHLQAIEYVKQATAHACIEQAIKDDSTSRELLERYKKEKSRFEETVRSFCEAGKAYMASHERLVTVREKLSRVKHLLVELEDEVLCCEAENANDKGKLLQITKCMSECKESMQNSYQEVEDAFKVL